MTKKIILSVLAVVGLLIGLKVFGFFGFLFGTAEQSTRDVVKQTLDADLVIANYEQFKDDYNGAKAVAQNVKMAEASMDEIREMYGEPDTWDKDTRKEYNFQKQTRDGLLMQYQSIVKTYNANSEKLNRNVFKDSDLPYTLPLEISELY